MTSTSALPVGRARGLLFAAALAIGVTQPWSASVNGLSPADDLASPYYLGEIAPPAWQGRPLAIPLLGGLGE
jgi:hypothetical protein